MSNARLLRPSGEPLPLDPSGVLAVAVHDAGSDPSETAVALTSGHKTRVAGTVENVVAALRAAGWHGVPALLEADSIGAQAMPGDAGLCRGFVCGDAKGVGAGPALGLHRRALRLGQGSVRVVTPAALLVAGGAA